MPLARLARYTALAFLVLIVLTPATPATAGFQVENPSYESPTSPMEMPWGG